MKIIDAHAHLVAKPDYQQLELVAESGLFQEIWLMDLSGAELAGAGLASEAEILAVTRRFPELFRAFGYLDYEAGPDGVDQQREKGFVGLKPYKPGKPYHEEAYFPIYERAAALKMPILFHTGMVMHTIPNTQRRGLSRGAMNMRPAMLDAIAEAFPHLLIIGGHLGYPWLEETAESLYYYANIYHDFSGYRKDIEWFTRNLDRKCNDGTGRFFNDKFLFGTDTCYGVEAGWLDARKQATFWELYLELIGGNYYRWGAPEEREKLLGGNAAQIAKAAWNIESNIGAQS